MTVQSLVDNAKKIVTDKYLCVNGRAGRAEFWQFVLAVFIVNFLLGIVDSVIGIRVLSGLFLLAILLPSLACTARRLHDIGKSGWLQLISLIPLFGVIILLVLCAKPGDEAANQYGASVK